MNGLSMALEPMAWVLVHFLWQGALVALAVAGTLALLRVADARQRYFVACAGLALMAFLPVATAWYLDAGALSFSGVATPNAEASTSSLTSLASSVPQALLLAGSAGSQGSDVASLRQRAEVLLPLLPWLAIAWLVGVVLMAAVHMGGWHRIRHLRRETRPAPERWEQALHRLADQIGISQTVELLESTRVQVPLVLGWFRPVILVPASSFIGLSPQQLEAVLAHELAHIRRHDYLVNLLQIAIETLLFYHPAVWWISHQVRVERENCCDDLAVELCGSPVTYARALADLEDLRYGTPALALGADGGSLLGRIRRLTGRDEEKSADSWLAAAVAALAAMLVTTFGVGVLMIASSSNAMPAEDPATQQETTGKSVRWEAEEVAWEAEEVAWEAEEQTWEAEEAREAEREAQEEAREAEREAREEAREAEHEAREAEREAREKAREAEREAREAEHEAREEAREAEREAREEAREAEREAREEAREAEREAREEAEGHRHHRWNNKQWLAEEVEELRRSIQGTSHEGLSDDDLRQLVRHGVDGDDLRAYAQAGIGAGSTDDLLRLARHGVDGDDAAEYQRAGLGDLNAEEIVRLARHGVDGDDIQEMARAGYNNLTVDDVVTAARHGLDGDDIQEFAAAGFENLSLEDMTRLTKHGLDGDDVRDFQQSGYTDLTLDDLVSLARHGIDGDDVREYRDAGFPDLSVDDLVGLARHGLDGDDIGEFKEAGFDLSLEQLTSLARHGVDGDDAQEIRDAGYADISFDEMVDLARHGVDGDDLQDLRDAGHNLSIEEVIRLARRGGLDEMTRDDD